MNFSFELPEGVVLRPVQKLDARALTEAFQKNRAHLAPWEPIRPDKFYTVQGQQEVITRQRRELSAGTGLPMVLVRKEDVVGLLTLSSMVRGAFQNAHLGYWMDQALQGSGIMTAAVAAAVNIAKHDLALHRLEAATLVHNTASQRVLEKNGFESYGTARAYLRIAGMWQDHRMFQRIL
ncbi:[SSU ribosomal protein S5P]-alanine acetyltransferase [Arthrobacter sp. SLBN-83]|jgi:ribosomal-protein-alanine N-acetyltransferase|uniref:GNAT family N-acetyltransferase n=1 Tax=Arthrobacter sp. SLBN-83 TaxID=2768449 RepID=UPI00114F02C5|nr:GNAT family protein [Arthrobacter sp. SLBN-83]TQJ61014.1 [SSU ribosomal protein S5P]-alanine acetyltransferase [Arthrobacter sp. SLBN-83]